MKKVFLVGLLGVLMLGGMCQDAAAQTSYWAISGVMKTQGKEWRPFVTTVVRVSCAENVNEETVKNQFLEFYKEYVAQRTGLELRYSDIRAYRFDSQDRADTQRRSFQDEYNRQYSNTYAVNNFSVRCRD